MFCFLSAFPFTICPLVRGGRGDIARLAFACSPDARSIKTLEGKEEPGKDDIEVAFENIEAFLGYTPAPCRVFLTPAGTAEKPSLFWRLSASGGTTPKKELANLEPWHVKISVAFTGELHGPHQVGGEGSLLMLQPRVEPDATCFVILPVLVNHKHITAKDRLWHYKVTAEPKPDKRPAEPIHVVQDFKKSRLAGDK